MKIITFLLFISLIMSSCKTANTTLPNNNACENSYDNSLSEDINSNNNERNSSMYQSCVNQILVKEQKHKKEVREGVKFLVLLDV